MKIVTVVGARPQFIKASVFSNALKEHVYKTNTHHLEVMVHTGQHYDANMSKIFFDEMGISAPKYNLGINASGHGKMIGQMLIQIEEVLLKEKPDCLLVYGDTNSTLAGALAASKLNIMVAHIESGLRSFNKRMPEEINRILTDHVSDLLFVPSVTAEQNLLSEGVDEGSIIYTGDVMYDACLFFGNRSELVSNILDRTGLDTNNYVLATVHRAENTDDEFRLKVIIDGLIDISNENDVVLPLHPRTRACLSKYGLLGKAEKYLKLIEPVGYLDMIKLLKNARLVATDSGGVQKEAFFFKTPCITLRDETEWVELVDLGWNKLVPPTSARCISDEVLKFLNCVGADEQPYGDGDASVKIVKELINRLE